MGTGQIWWLQLNKIMIQNLKIQTKKITAMPMEQVLKKLEGGGTVTNLAMSEQIHLKLEMDLNRETLDQVIESISNIGKAASAKG